MRADHRLGGGGSGEEVRVTGRLDRHDTDAEKLSGGSAESDVGSGVQVDGGLGEHGVVLELGATEGRAVAGDEHKSALAGAHSLQSRLESASVLARL